MLRRAATAALDVPKECTVEEHWCRVAAQLGIAQVPLKTRGTNHWPDRLFFKRGGKPLLVEFKRPGEEPRKAQHFIHTTLRAAGYEVQVHDTKEAARPTLES